MRIQNISRGKVGNLRKLLMAIGAGTIGLAGPAFADHIFYIDIPFDSRGECEAQTAELDNGDREWLSEANGLSDGEIRSMLKRAWTCEIGADGQWYIIDHRVEILSGEWWQRRIK